MAILTETLAVKYRSNKFSDFVGQPHVLTQLKGIFKSLKIPKTILITGATGQGKTTLARLIAKYLNCETNNGCGKCLSCSFIHENSHPDVLEYNLSDNRGIDDVRAITQSAHGMPRFKYRVYVLDEVHQLTSHAQNAFLKALEEPPAKTVFILSTTNPEKLLPAITGRCFKLSLKPIKKQDVIDRLSAILEKEDMLEVLSHIDKWEDTLDLIASLGNGSLRDSISLLENALYAVKSLGELDLEDSKSVAKLNKVFSKSGILSTYVSSSEADLDKSAVMFLLTVLQQDLLSCARTVRECTNLRGLHSKLKWLVVSAIDDLVGTAQFSSYAVKLLKQQASKQKLELDLYVLIRILEKLDICEQRFYAGASDIVAMLSLVSSVIQSE